ncbi:MAG: Hsp20/alpha crystallin family protein [Spirochaetales bacterium]|nr:Hsp20/alpha crystallin family protein [Spirochaetales bacterium]
MMTLRYRDDVMDNVWNNFFGASSVERFSPVYDVVESNLNYVLSFELPGVEEDIISIEVKDRELTLEVKEPELKNEAEDNKDKFLVKNRRSKNFRKVFRLPEDVNPDAVVANINSGVLTLTIDKREQVQPKKILINKA